MDRLVKEEGRWSRREGKKENRAKACVQIDIDRVMLKMQEKIDSGATFE